jgi:hypothetical protein
MVYAMENLENPNLKWMIDNWENHGLETSIYNHLYISETFCNLGDSSNEKMKVWGLPISSY